MAQTRSKQELANVPLQEWSDEELKRGFDDNLASRSYVAAAQFSVILGYRGTLAKAAKFKGNGRAAVHVDGVQPFKYNGCEQLESLVEEKSQIHLEQAATKVAALANTEAEREKAVAKSTGIPFPDQEFSDVSANFEKALEKDPKDVLTDEDLVRYQRCIKLKESKLSLAQIMIDPQPAADQLNGRLNVLAGGISPMQVTAAQMKAAAAHQWNIDNDEAVKMSDQTPVSTAKKVWARHGDAIQLTGGGIVFVAGLLGPDEVVIPIAAVVGVGTGGLALAAEDYGAAFVNLASAVPIGKLASLFRVGGESAGAGQALSAAAEKRLAGLTASKMASMDDVAIRAEMAAAKKAGALTKQQEDELEKYLAKRAADKKVVQEAVEEDAAATKRNAQKAHPEAEGCPC